MTKDKFPRMRALADQIQRDMGISDEDAAALLDMSIRVYHGDNKRWPGSSLCCIMSLIYPRLEYLLGQSDEPFAVRPEYLPRKTAKKS